MATATKTEKVRFAAPGTGLHVRYVHAQEVFTEGGKKNVKDPGEVIDFVEDGLGAQQFETSDPEKIAYLRERINTGEAAFYEVPIPTPSSSPVLSAIAKCAARGDVDGLVAIAKEEEETFQREDVLETIADALESLKG